MSPDPRPDCGGPDDCIDDLCAGSDRGICGRWSAAAYGEDWGQEHEDDTEETP